MIQATGRRWIKVKLKIHTVPSNYPVVGNAWRLTHTKS